jgi:hypothetical protein
MTNPPRKGNGKAIQWIRQHATYQGDDCVSWPFKGANGYGIFGYLGHPYYAHRFMCELTHGAPPAPEYEASHSCGNGHLGCTNPRHLSWKTPSQNQLDRRTHGNPNSWGGRGKVTLAQAAEIRALRGKKTQTEIAKMYGLTQPAVSFIQLGKRQTKETRWNRPLNPNGETP